MSKLTDEAKEYASKYSTDPKLYEIAFNSYFEGAKKQLEDPSGGALLHVLNKGVKQGQKETINKALLYLGALFYNSSVGFDEKLFIEKMYED